MPSRPIPRSKLPVFKTVVHTKQYRMEVPKERDEYDRLVSDASRGLISFVYNGAPEMDHRGNYRFLVSFSEQVPLTQQEALAEWERVNNAVEGERRPVTAGERLRAARAQGQAPRSFAEANSRELSPDEKDALEGERWGREH